MHLGLQINHRYIYFFGLALVVASLPLSKVTTSAGELILFGNWILEGHFKTKFHAFFRNKTALIICSLFLLHIIGLIYSTDFNYAIFDLRVKIPMLILPLIISTTEPLNKKQFYNFLLLFILAVTASTLASLYNYLTIDYLDIREICKFISHIRLSLMICLSIFILLYFVFIENDFDRKKKIAFVFIAAWFTVFLIILESITGLLVLFITSMIIALASVIKMNNLIYKSGILLGALFLTLLITFYISSVYKDYSSDSSMNSNIKRTLTALGNPYSHDTLNSETENGNYIYWNINQNELRDAWDKRSSYKYDGNDKKGQYLKYTLIRFLTSKGYYKDAEGVSKLTGDEVKAIENGVASVNFIEKKSLKTRIYETIWELSNFQSNVNPNGHTVMQRIEYWKASIGIIHENLLFGVGTGDMNIAFADQYNKMGSRLDAKWRLRSHNQFLSIAVDFGLFGFLWFLIVLIYPFFFRWVRKDFFYIVFFIILFLSMFAEDTIESQTGLTFYVFFNALLLLGRKRDDSIQ